jgi:hypothetical protein
VIVGVFFAVVGSANFVGGRYLEAAVALRLAILLGLAVGKMMKNERWHLRVCGSLGAGVVI